jgi:tyrosyl-tRNA synthetase
MDVDIEMCGNDQKFNALVGRTLLKKIRNKEKFVFITNLLENPVTKEKMMSKSLGTGVFLDESSANMFGQIMAQADENILQLFTDCTYVPLEEIKKIKKQLKENKVNPRDIKMKLAFEITKIFHKEKEAQKAQEQFIKTVQKKEAPEEMPDLKVSKNASVVVAVVEAGLAQSNAEAKRKIKQGGVEIGGHKIMDINTKINSSMNGQVFKVGKRGFRKIQIN